MAKISRKVLITGVTGFAILAAGCSSIGANLRQQAMNQIGNKVAEKMLEGASGGKIDVKADGTSFTFKDPKTGAVVNMSGDNKGGFSINSSNGTEQMVGGASVRPDAVPANLPSIDGAADFGWYGANGNGMFSFQVSGTDYKTACNTELDLLAKAGWTLKTDFSMEFGKSISKSLENGDTELSLTCSGNDNGTVVVQLVTSKKSSSN